MKNKKIKYYKQIIFNLTSKQKMYKYKKNKNN